MSSTSTRRRPRRRTQRVYTSLSPFNLLNKKKRDIDRDFSMIAGRCHNLLTEGYDFCTRFTLKPDESTEVNAMFENEVTLHRQRQSLNFDRTGSGAASVRLKDNFFLFVAELSTLQTGKASTFIKMGDKNSFFFCDANTLLEADSSDASTKIGVAVRSEGVGSANIHVDVMKSFSMGGCVALQPMENLKVGLRSRILEQDRRTIEVRAAYHGESFHEITGQPQEFVIGLAGDVSGRYLSASYLHNMIVPVGDSLHRLSMGGEFIHRSIEPLFPSKFLEPSYSNQRSSANSNNSRLNQISLLAGLQPRTPESVNSLVVGTVWQPLQNVLFKFRTDVVGNIGCLVAFRSWWSVSNITVALSSQINMLHRETLKIGCYFAMESA